MYQLDISQTTEPATYHFHMY